MDFLCKILFVGITTHTYISGEKKWDQIFLFAMYGVLNSNDIIIYNYG